MRLMALLRLAAWRPPAMAPLALALLACLVSLIALFGPGRAAMPLPAPALPGIEARLALVGVEMLLPHLARAAPFPRAYAIAQVLAAEDAELAAALRPLGPAAGAGAPLPGLLAEAFGPVAEAAVRAEAGLAPDGPLAGLTLRAMRLGAALGAGASPALAATQAAAVALAQRDLPAADAALAPLGPAAAEAVAAWRAMAARRIAVDAAAARLARLLRQRAA